MEMRTINAGKLRAIGYDASKRMLQVTLDDGTVWEYLNVGEYTWQQFKQSNATWSFYRDHIEDTFSARRGSRAVTANTTRNPLDDLFG